MSQPGAGPVSEQEYNNIVTFIYSLRLADLKLVAKALSIAQAGRKADVCDRIKRYLQIGKDSQDVNRVRAIGKIVGQAFRQEPVTPYETVYASLNLMTPRSQPSQFSSSQPSGYSQDPIPRNQSNPRKPWLFFKENPFFVLKKLVTPNAGVCIKAPNARGTGQVSFQLSEQDSDLLRQSSSYKLFLLCGAYDKNKPSTDALVEFPQPLEIHFNKVQIKDNVKGLKNKPGTARPANLTPYVAPAGHTNSLNMVYAFTKIDYLIFCYLIEEVSPDKILQKVLSNPHIVKEKTLHDFQNEGDDDDIQEVSTRLSLKCPLSFTRFKYPAKSIACKHVPCFDALSFIYLQEQASTWTCPVCSIPVKVKDIAIDDYVMDIMKNTDDEVETVEIDLDGSWKPIYEEGEGTPQRKPSQAPESSNNHVKQETKGSSIAKEPTPGGSDSPIIISLDSDEEEEDQAPPPPPQQKQQQVTSESQATANTSPSSNDTSHNSHQRQTTTQPIPHPEKSVSQAPLPPAGLVPHNNGTSGNAEAINHSSTSSNNQQTSQSPNNQQSAPRILPQPQTNVQTQQLPPSVQPSAQQQQFDILSHSIPQHQSPDKNQSSPNLHQNQNVAQPAIERTNSPEAHPQFDSVGRFSNQINSSIVRKPPPQSPPIQNNYTASNQNAAPNPSMNHNQPVPDAPASNTLGPLPTTVPNQSNQSDIASLGLQRSNNGDDSSRSSTGTGVLSPQSSVREAPNQGVASISPQGPAPEPARQLTAYEREMLEVNQLKQRINRAGKSTGPSPSPALPPALPAHQRFDRLSTNPQSQALYRSTSVNSMSVPQVHRQQIQSNGSFGTNQAYPAQGVFRCNHNGNQASSPLIYNGQQTNQVQHGSFSNQVTHQQHPNHQVQGQSRANAAQIGHSTQFGKGDGTQKSQQAHRFINIQSQSQGLNTGLQQQRAQHFQQVPHVPHIHQNMPQVVPASHQHSHGTSSSRGSSVSTQSSPRLPGVTLQNAHVQNSGQQRRVLSNPDSTLAQTAQQSSLKASLDNYQLNRANTINIPQSHGHPGALQNVQRLRENLNNRQQLAFNGQSAGHSADTTLQGTDNEPSEPLRRDESLQNGLTAPNKTISATAAATDQSPNQALQKHQEGLQQNPVQGAQPAQVDQSKAQKSVSPMASTSPSLSSVNIPSWSNNHLLRSTSTAFSPSRFAPPQASNNAPASSSHPTSSNPSNNAPDNSSHPTSSNPSNTSSPQIASATPSSAGNAPPPPVQAPAPTTSGILGISVDTNSLFKKKADTVQNSQSSQMQKSRTMPSVFIPSRRPMSSEKRKVFNQGAPEHVKRSQQQSPVNTNSAQLAKTATNTAAPQPAIPIVPGPRNLGPTLAGPPKSRLPPLTKMDTTVVDLTSDEDADDDTPLLRRNDRPINRSN